MAVELFSANFDSASDLDSYDLRTSGNTDTQIVTENGNGVLEIVLDRFVDPVSYRSEVELAGRNPARFAALGKTYTYSFDIRLGTDWVHDDHPEILFQLHSSPDEGDGSRGPSLALQLMPSLDHSTTYYSIVQRGDERDVSASTSTSHVTTPVGRIDGDLGDWVNWTFQIHLSPDNDGRLTVWKDGAVVLHQEGQANAFNDELGPYAKWGVYKWDWLNTNTIASSRSLQYDNLRILEGDDVVLGPGFASPDDLPAPAKFALPSGGYSYAPHFAGAADGASGIDMEGNTGHGTLVGTAASDYLHDNLGNDTLHGGAGDDRLVSGSGNDTAYGGVGIDRIELGDGNDTGRGGDGADTILGGAGRDVLYGDAGNDTLRGQDGNDFLFGGAGNDKLDGGAGDDRLEGGWGQDTLIGGHGQDMMIGGGDADRFIVSGNATIRDFSQGDGDRIDISAFGHLSELSYIGAEFFSGSGAAEVRFADAQLLVDVDGNGSHDYSVTLLGAADISLTSYDLILG